MRSTALLRRQILSRQARIAVVGQGYVGLSVACAAAEVGFPVLGIDLDPARVDELRRGILSVPGVREDTFRSSLATGLMSFTTRSEAIRDSSIILVCVPTPVRDHTPDLSYVEGACEDVARHLSAGSLVVLESTTYPGTTEGPVRIRLETSGLLAGTDFLLAYSPERIDPGNEEFHFRNTPRVVAGMTPEATGVVALFYEQIVDKVVVVSSCRSAELSKLLENTFRHVNVALVNEMAMLCNEMGINIWEVVDAAASKPFGFMPFYPGPGVGGHCIPLDPTYLAWQVRRDAGHQFRILEQSQDINAQMPGWVASRIGDALNDVGKPVRGARILVLGVAYKPDIGDVRESPALEVMTHLHRKGAALDFHDPYVGSAVVADAPLNRTDLTRRALARSDCVAILTPHKAYDLEWIGENANLIFDARNAFNGQRRANVVQL